MPSLKKFSRINFDDVDVIYQEALNLYKAGKINEAITKLESANPSRRTADIIKEEKRIAEAQKELDAQKAALATEKKKQIAAVRLLADMYSINFDSQKAENQYDELLLLDSTDLAILQDAGDFFYERHRYDKAFNLFQKIIHHPEAKAWEIANIYSFIGDIYSIKRKFARGP